MLDQRRRFIDELASGQWSMSELCARFGVSRPDRLQMGGPYGVRRRGRSTIGATPRTSAPIDSRRRWPRCFWPRGASRLGSQETAYCFAPPVPALRLGRPAARSTICSPAISLLRPARRAVLGAPGDGAARDHRAESSLARGFQRSVQDRRWAVCYPLTVTDHFSRRLLLCQGCPSVPSAVAGRSCARSFARWACPRRSGPITARHLPPPSFTACRPSNVWWMQLGIVHQRIPPASPQHNGTHERMHRELKRETTRPAAATRRAQQRRFDAFRTPLQPRTAA